MMFRVSSPTLSVNSLRVRWSTRSSMTHLKVGSNGGSVQDTGLQIFDTELTYPTLGKGKSSSKCPFLGEMLVPWMGIFISTWGSDPI